MHPGLIATLLCVGATAATGCGTADDRPARDADASRDTGRTDPALVEVPDVTGQTAEKAASVLEAAGFRPTLDPEPEDPELCKVADQDQTGEIEEGSEVILTIDCMVDVPDVSGDPADDAVSKLTALGLTTSFEEKPDDSSACTVESQDVVGQAEAGSEVVLTVRCVLPDVTGRDLRSAVAALQRIGYDADHPPVRDPRVCSVTSHRTQAEPGATVALTVHCPG